MEITIRPPPLRIFIHMTINELDNFSSVILYKIKSSILPNNTNGTSNTNTTKANGIVTIINDQVLDYVSATF